MVKLLAALGEYTPDAPDISLTGMFDGMQKVNNVIPRTVESYGPMPELAAFSSNALDAPCQGAASLFGLDGSGNIFAGNATKLYRLVGRELTNVSGTAYSIPDDSIWSFCSYGNMVFALNVAHPIQQYTLGSSTTFADLSANAPKARYACVYKNFLITGNNTHPSYGTTPHSVWWSAIGQPANWPTIASPDAFAFQSDRREISGSHGEVMGLVPGIGGAVACIMRGGIFRLSYVGSPIVFEIDHVETLNGAISPASICANGGVAYYLGEDGFYAFDGSSARPIGNNKVNKLFFNELDPSGLERISASVDPINYVVFWAYSRSITGGISRYIAYNYMLDRWASGDLAVEWLFRGTVPGMTLEQIGDVYPDLENIPFSLDSRIWQGGKTAMAMFNHSHELCFLTGNAKEATLETEDAHMNGRIFTVQGIRPLTDAPSFSVATGARFNTNEQVTYGASAGPETDGIAPQRSAGRYARVKITIPAETTWTQCQGVEIDVTQDGRR